jgi:hypothetical protein
VHKSENRGPVCTSEKRGLVQGVVSCARVRIGVPCARG